MPTMLKIIIGSVLFMVIWFFFSVRSAKKRKQKLKNSPQKKSSRKVSDNFEQNINQILKQASQNRAIKPTVTQWVTQYENVSALQKRLLQVDSRATRGGDTKQDFAHQMIEKQKQEIERNAKELLVALQNKDKSKIKQICNPTLEKAEAVQRAMQQDQERKIQ